MSERPPNLPERDPVTPSPSPEKNAQQDSAPTSAEQGNQDTKKIVKDAKEKAKRGGDVNVAQVGEGAQIDQFAQGRNIFQAKVSIGTLQVPVRFIAALVALALVAAVVVWYFATPDTMPTEGGSFNIAVADFGVQDAQGNVTSSADASNWSKWMFDTLVNETKQLPGDRKITIWHDSLRPLQERATIGLIQGKTPSERELAAEQKAKDLYADLVIYGNFATNQQPGTFVPEFYLAKGRNEADEMRGSQAMGKPFDLPTPLSPADQLTRNYLDKNLTPRAVALAWFVPGLIDDLSGDFEKAHDKFTAALTQVKGLKDDQGKAVFYYYLGREAQFLSQDKARARAFYAATDPGLSGSDAALMHSEESFRTAIQLDPTYARAYFGLAGTFYQHANLILSETFAGDHQRAQVPELLEQAIQLHQRTLELAGDTPDSLIDIQARLQLGFDYYLQGRLALEDKNYAGAEQSLRQAQTELETGLRQLPADQHRTLAQVYLALARTASLSAQARAEQGDSDGARQFYLDAGKAYDSCISEAATVTQDDYLNQLKKTCETGKQANLDALGKLN